MSIAELNNEQKAAVLSKHNRILCLAGAGTGKTKTLIARIEFLMNCGITPDSILVLTFTRNAAFEMQHRFNSAVGGKSPTFQTFHAFCYSLLVEDETIRRQKFGYTSPPDIAPDASWKELISFAETQIGVRLGSYNRWKKSKAQLSAKDAMLKQLLDKAVHRKMLEMGVISFDLLSESISALFENDDPMTKKYKERFKYIFVDEFQDTDMAQSAFVKSFKDSNIFVVGDALQNLYSFRGTTAEIIKGLSENPDWEVHRLYKNYRSTKQICDYANTNSTYARGKYRIEIESDREGPDVKECRVSMKDRQIIAQLETINSIVQNEIETSRDNRRTTAILCRTNREVDLVKEGLRWDNIEHSDKTYPTEFALNALRAVNDEQFCIQWISSQLKYEDYTRYLRDRIIVESATGHYGMTEFCASQTPYALIRFEDILDKIRDILNSSRTYQEKFEQLNRFIYGQIVIDDINRINRCNSDAELIDIILDAKVEQLNNAIYVGTIHSVKGLEYDNVILVGVDGPSFQRNSEDAYNLFYVGVTRAKTRLWVLRKE